MRARVRFDDGGLARRYLQDAVEGQGGEPGGLAVPGEGQVDGAGLVAGERFELNAFGSGQHAEVQREAPAVPAECRGMDLGERRAELGRVGRVLAGPSPVQLLDRGAEPVEEPRGRIRWWARVA